MANVTKNDLHALYLKILPYLAPQVSGQGGHTIEDNTGTDLTDRDTLQFGGDLEASDDSTNEKTVIEPHELTNAEIADIFTQVPITPVSTYVPNTGFTPVGTVISVMGNHAPAHYLVCDGTEYYISEYPVLADYFETEFGEKNHFGGNGTTTFAVPDLQGEFLRGTGTNSHTQTYAGKTMSQGNGAAVGTHQNATIVPHAYTTEGNHIIRKQSSTVGLAVASADSTVTSGTYGKVASTNGSSESTAAYTTRPTNTSVLYCIAVQNIYIDAHSNYSTDEKVVGRWVDGKPIYQKTFDFGALPNNTTKTVNHNISNVDKIVRINAFIYNPTLNRTYMFPWTATSGFIASLDADRESLRVITASDRHEYSAYVTLQYTKTTD